MVQRDGEHIGLKAALTPVKAIAKPPVALMKQFSHHHHQFFLPRKVQDMIGSYSQSWANSADILP